MKYIIINIAFILFLAQEIYCSCDCGQGNVFNGDKEMCQEIPKDSGDIGHIENCLNYVSGSNGVECLKCKPGFMALNDTCEDTGFANCMHTAIGANGDICTDCAEGLYANQDGSECVQNPQSGQQDFIQDCQIYTAGSRVECFECIKGKYVDISGNCVNNPVQGENGFLQNCGKYQQQRCVRCDDGFLFNYDQSECVSISSVNCKVSDGNHCLYCNDGYYPRENEICKQLPQQGENGFVENCRVYMLNGQNLQCDRCKNGYYLDESDSSCKQAEASLEKCTWVMNDSDGYMCMDCLEGYSLKNQNTCIKCPDAKEIQEQIQKMKQNSGVQQLEFLGGIAMIIISIILI